MILEKPNTTVSELSKELIALRDEGGVVALSRVLTLVILSRPGEESQSVQAANVASSEHPMRIIVVVHDPDAPSRLDAEIRVGSDAGASEVVILKVGGAAGDDVETLVTGLLLPDVPVVLEWASGLPSATELKNMSTLSNRRIFNVEHCPDPHAALLAAAAQYQPGDTDIAWARLTLWRSHLASMLDAAKDTNVLSAEIAGDERSIVVELMRAWLALQLQCPVVVSHDDQEAALGGGVCRVSLKLSAGVAELRRVTGQHTATISSPGQPTHELALPRRTPPECIAEELRHFGEDKLFGMVVQSLLD